MNNLEKMFYNVGKAGEKMSKKLAERFSVNIKQDARHAKGIDCEYLANTLVITRGGTIYYIVRANHNDDESLSTGYFCDGFLIDMDPSDIYRNIDENDYSFSIRTWDLFKNAYPFYNYDEKDMRYRDALYNHDILYTFRSTMDNDYNKMISELLKCYKGDMFTPYIHEYSCHRIAPNTNMLFKPNLSKAFTDFASLEKEMNRCREKDESVDISVTISDEDSREYFKDELLNEKQFTTITIPDSCISEFINTYNIGKFLADCEYYNNTDELVDFYKNLVKDNNGLLFYIRVFSELLDIPWEELVEKHTPKTPSQIILSSEANMTKFLRYTIWIIQKMMYLKNMVLVKQQHIV